MKKPWEIDVNVLMIFFVRDGVLKHTFEAVKKARPRRLFLWQDGPREGRADDLEGIERCRKIVEDIVVTEITKNSIASAFGLVADDVLKTFKVNDTVYTLNRYFDIGDILYKVKEGDNISFTYTRGEENKNSSVYKVLASDIKTVE